LKAEEEEVEINRLFQFQNSMILTIRRRIIVKGMIIRMMEGCELKVFLDTVEEEEKKKEPKRFGESSRERNAGISPFFPIMCLNVTGGALVVDDNKIHHITRSAEKTTRV
jgi:hypothetical protein